MENNNVPIFVRINKKHETWLREKAKEEGRTLGKQFERLCEKAQQNEGKKASD